MCQRRYVEVRGTSGSGGGAQDTGGKRGKDRKERGEDKGRGELGVMVGMQKETGGEAFEWH